MVKIEADTIAFPLRVCRGISAILTGQYRILEGVSFGALYRPDPEVESRDSSGNDCNHSGQHGEHCLK